MSLINTCNLAEYRKVQRSMFYEMSIILSTSNSNRRAAQGCDTFDSVENVLIFTTKFHIRVKLVCYYSKRKISEFDWATKIEQRQSINWTFWSLLVYAYACNDFLLIISDQIHKVYTFVVFSVCWLNWYSCFNSLLLLHMLWSIFYIFIQADICKLRTHSCLEYPYCMIALWCHVKTDHWNF